MLCSDVDDFCLWAPPSVGSIGDTERDEVAWCTKSGRGTRTIPNGALKGVHFVKTPDYVQVTGQGDFTKINVPKGDEGGELDPHGSDGNGNPGTDSFPFIFRACSDAHQLAVSCLVTRSAAPSSITNGRRLSPTPSSASVPACVLPFTPPPRRT
jgi:hypothetical protein